jgi:transposase
VKWISRDRSGEYTCGAQLGAPDARHVMDRWHVIKNWREALERVVSRLSPQLEQRLHKPATPAQETQKTTQYPRASHL